MLQFCDMLQSSDVVNSVYIPAFLQFISIIVKRTISFALGSALVLLSTIKVVLLIQEDKKNNH